MKKIRINFTGMSIRSNFDPYHNPILDILKKHYEVEICDDPDFVICGVLYPGGYWSNGVFDKYVMDYPCVRVMIEGENYVPDYNLVDYSISPYPIQYFDRNFYFPCGVEALTTGVSYLPELQKKNRDYPDSFLGTKQYFASFIESHDSEHQERSTFFNQLNSIKRVESAGSYLNNMENGYRVNWLDGSKTEFQRKSKFSICIEPLKHDGWIAERIVDGFYNDTIPIYYGSANISDIFNPRAFINLNDYEDFDSAIKRIQEIDNDDELYMYMIRQPIFNQPDFPERLMKDLEDYLCHIFDQEPEKAFRRARIYSPKKHEEFMARSIQRAEKMDIEGIRYVPDRGKTDKDITKEYIKHTPNRLLMKLIGKGRYEKLKQRLKRK